MKGGLPVPCESLVKTCLSKKNIGRAAVWAVFAAAAGYEALLHQREVLGFPALTRPLGPFDPDNWLYLTQVREWLHGGLRGFFDHRVVHTNAPFGGVDIHWTRPLQMLLAAFYFLMPWSLPVDTRLLLSATWLPPCIGFAALLLLAQAARKRFNHVSVNICAGVLLLLTPYREDYFAPGASDHHGLLSMLWCGVLVLMMDRALSYRRALLLGGLLGLMVWTSLEALALTGFIFALLGVEALVTREKARNLALAALGAALVAALGLFVETPVRDILSHPLYDTLSIVQVALLAFSAAGAILLALLFGLKRDGKPVLSFGARFFAAAVAGSSVLLAEWFFYPKFFAGPLVDADPYIFSDFLPRVGELQPLLRLPDWDIAGKAAEPALAAILLLLGFFTRRARRRQLLIFLALLAATFDLTLFELRWNYYLQPVAIVAAAALLPGCLRFAAGRLRLCRLARHFGWVRWRFLTGPALILTAFAWHPEVPEMKTSAFNCLEQIRYVVQTGQLQPLLGQRDLVLLTQSDAGADVLFFTPYRILASNFHREGLALRDLARLETKATPEAARALLQVRQVNALLYCPVAYDTFSWINSLDGLPHQRSSLFGASYVARRPLWITPVSGLHFMDIEGPRPSLYRMEP